MASRMQDSWGNEHGPRRGLEGPFKRPDGSVVYYDPRYQGGRYWDPLSDMYLDRDIDPFRRSAGDDGGDDDSKGKSKGKPGGKMIEFLKQEGDRMVTSPDTGNRIKLKSLGKGEKGKKVLQKHFQKWLDAQDKKKKDTRKKVDKIHDEREKAQSKSIDKKMRQLLDKVGPEKAHKLLGLPGKPPKDNRTEDQKLDSKIRNFVREHGMDEAKKRLRLAHQTVVAAEERALRSKLIRLAHENPELRSQLLPLLKEARRPQVPVGDVRKSRKPSSWGATVWEASVTFPDGTVNRAHFAEGNDVQWNWMPGVDNAKDAAKYWVKEYRRSNPNMEFSRGFWRAAATDWWSQTDYPSKGDQVKVLEDMSGYTVPGNSWTKVPRGARGRVVTVYGNSYDVDFGRLGVLNIEQTAFGSKRHGYPAKVEKTAGGDYYFLAEDADGYLFKFDGPMSMSQARRLERDRRVSLEVDEGGSTSIIPADKAVRELSFPSAEWSRKLPSADKAKFDQAKGGGARMASDLQFDRFYKSLDAIRKKISDSRDFRDLDLAAEHVPTYVRGGVRAGYLPRSFTGKYNRLLKGMGIAGVSGEGIAPVQKKWLGILDEMQMSAQRIEARMNK